MKFAYLFPGQGSQYIGMGKSFVEAFPESAQVFEEADDILQFPLSKLILTGDTSDLTQTKNSQPAIFVTSIAILRALEKIFDLPSPAFTAGLSLGEYSALTAAGTISFQDALPLVATRGRLMHQACEDTKGTMAVVLGLDDSSVQDIVDSLQMPSEIFCANFNCPGQVVISGTILGIEKAKEALTNGGAKHILPLQVHGAFHSGLMQSASTGLKPYLQTAPIVLKQSQVAMNVTGRFAESADEIRKLLIQQVTSPTRWSEGIRTIDSQTPSHYIEIGCGSTLTGMNKKIGVASPSINIDTTEDLKKLEEIFKG